MQKSPWQIAHHSAHDAWPEAAPDHPAPAHRRAVRRHPRSSLRRADRLAMSSCLPRPPIWAIAEFAQDRAKLAFDIGQMIGAKFLFPLPCLARSQMAFAGHRARFAAR